MDHNLDLSAVSFCPLRWLASVPVIDVVFPLLPNDEIVVRRGEIPELLAMLRNAPERESPESHAVAAMIEAVATANKSPAVVRLPRLRYRPTLQAIEAEWHRRGQVLLPPGIRELRDTLADVETI